MNVTVGILYSVQDFLELAISMPMTVSDFKKSFKNFSVASAEDVISIAEETGCISVAEGAIEVTERGRELCKLPDEYMKLRNQLRTLLEIHQPPWTKKLRDGRKEATRIMPGEIRQIFLEAGLLEGVNEEVIEWWDDMASDIRKEHSRGALVTGRKAERLSFEHETRRLGRAPDWISVETDYAGFDILSQVNSETEDMLRIEVKGTTQRMEEAFISVTRNQWRTAKSSPYFEFHLWLLRNETKLFKVRKEEMEAHIPGDRGAGKWETARIPFSTFAENEISEG